MCAKDIILTIKQMELIRLMCYYIRAEIDNDDEHYLSEHELEIARLHRLIRSEGKIDSDGKIKLNIAFVVGSEAELKCPECLSITDKHELEMHGGLCEKCSAF